MSSRTIALPSGIRTRVIDRGSGPAVLLLHGNPDNADEWANVIAILADRHRCIAPDLPGYGTTDRTEPLPAGWSYTIDNQVAFVDELLAELGVGDVTLVVHDIGGIMGVPWAARSVRRLRGVIYTNTVAYPDWEWFPVAKMWGSHKLADRVRANLMMHALGARRGRLFARRFGQQHPQLGPRELSRFTADFAMNPVAKRTTLAQFKLLTAPRFFAGYDAMLKDIAAATPTRAVWGLADPYVPDERAPQLFAAKLDRLPEVGHWVPIVAAKQVAEHIVAGAAS
jgi:haloalkane dehalogenase